jgi:ketosteroid isomerase-like protein
MKFGCVAVLVLVLLSSGIGLAKTGQAKTENPPNAFEQTLIDAEKSFIAAAKKGDATFFKQTLTSDFSYVSYDGQLYDRQEMVDQYSQPGSNIQPYEMKVVSAGDGVAIVTYNVVFRVPPSQDQGPPPRYQHFTTVWLKQGDSWKMKFQQMTASHWGDW